MNADRALGALLGLACGDALGAPAEFLNRSTLQSQYGRLIDMVGGGIWDPGEWTDDTAMALCVAEGILAAPDDPVEEIGQRFLAWQTSGPKDVGSTISDALRRFCGNWPEAARSTDAARIGMAAGNGSLMRTLPVALAYADPTTMLRQSARISAMTHWDPQAEVGCAVYSLFARRLLRGESRLPAWRSALADARTVAWAVDRDPAETPGVTPLPPAFWDRLEGIEDLDEANLQPSGYAGYVLECLEAAVWWVIHAASFEDVLIGCVNLAGEADTIAAVAGGVAGAHWGAAHIPERWLERLHSRARIEDVGRGLLRRRKVEMALE